MTLFKDCEHFQQNGLDREMKYKDWIRNFITNLKIKENTEKCNGHLKKIYETRAPKRTISYEYMAEETQQNLKIDRVTNEVEMALSLIFGIKKFD